jgi:hypothetical protein
MTLAWEGSGKALLSEQRLGHWGKKGHLEVKRTTWVFWQGLAGLERRTWGGGRIDD